MIAMCRNCRKNAATRPRRMCAKCYYMVPPVREDYEPLRPTDVRGVANGNRRRTPALFATAARPGSAAKIEVLGIRARLGQELWHKDDEVMDRG